MQTGRATLVVAAGVLHAASIANPWSGQPAGWLQIVALSTFILQLLQLTEPRQAAMAGWLFATGWLAGTFWWLFVAMHTYGGLPAPLAALAVVALAATLAVYYAVASAAYAILAPANRWLGAALFAALWLLAELARGVWFTGFGWGGSAYAHVDGLAVSVQYIGAYGLAASVAFIAYLVAASVHARGLARRVRFVGVACLIVVLMVWSPRENTRPTSTLDVALLQGNIPQDEKFQAGSGVADALRWYAEQLAGVRATLVVAPETAIPLLPQQLPPAYWEALQQRYRSGAQAALVGVPMGNLVDGYTNSVVGFRPATGLPGPELLYRYDKHHLVPFGEFIPPFFKWFTEMMSIPLGDFSRGAVGQPSFAWRGERLAPNICYEDLFGEELAARFADAATAPTIFVNVSNIGWFGDTIAIDQHLSISRIRALEFERPFVRATNTGDTAVIDHTGRVTHALPRHTRGVLLARVQGREGLTVYAWWSGRFGLWPLWIFGVAVVAFATVLRLRQTAHHPMQPSLPPDGR